MGSDAEKMVAVGIVWGATNAFMRRGAQLWDRRLRDRSHGNKKKDDDGDDHGGKMQRRNNGLSSSAFKLWWKKHCNVRKWLELVLVWQYSIPFAINLSASAAFYHILGDAPISVAVPVTNATTFVSTAVFAMLLGEETHLGYALLGISSIVLGICLCSAY